jgi:hypothetical protein
MWHSQTSITTARISSGICCRHASSCSSRPSTQEIVIFASVRHVSDCSICFDYAKAPIFEVSFPNAHLSILQKKRKRWLHRLISPTLGIRSPERNGHSHKYSMDVACMYDQGCNFASKSAGYEISPPLPSSLPFPSSPPSLHSPRLPSPFFLAFCPRLSSLPSLSSLPPLHCPSYWGSRGITPGKKFEITQVLR